MTTDLKSLALAQGILDRLEALAERLDDDKVMDMHDYRYWRRLYTRKCKQIWAVRWESRGLNVKRREAEEHASYLALTVSNLEDKLRDFEADLDATIKARDAMAQQWSALSDELARRDAQLAEAEELNALWEKAVNTQTRRAIDAEERAEKAERDYTHVENCFAQEAEKLARVRECCDHQPSCYRCMDILRILDGEEV